MPARRGQIKRSRGESASWRLLNSELSIVYKPFIYEIYTANPKRNRKQYIYILAVYQTDIIPIYQNGICFYPSIFLRLIAVHTSVRILYPSPPEILPKKFLITKPYKRILQENIYMTPNAKSNYSAVPLR